MVYRKQYVWFAGSIPSLLALICLACFVGLGYWQLIRAEYKRTLLQQYADNLHKPAQNLPLFFGNNKPTQYTVVKVKGKFDNHHHIFIDNKIYEHRKGYHLLTPLFVDGRVLLVNRGWIKQTPNQGRLGNLPFIAPIDKEITIEGYIYYPDTPFTLGPISAKKGWPQLIQALDSQFLSQIFSQPVYPFILLLKDNQPHGFLREWKPAVSMPPMKHTAYAFQWFALAAAVIVIYFVLSFKSKSKL